MKKLILSILFILCLSFQASAWNPMVVVSGGSGAAKTDYTADANCMGAWFMNGGLSANGDDETDRSGEGVTLVETPGADNIPNSANVPAGYSGSSRDFELSEFECLEAGDIAAVDFSGADQNMSIVAWINVESINTTDIQTIVGKSDRTIPDRQYALYIVGTDTDKYDIRFRIGDTPNLTISTTTTYATEVWLHAAVVYNDIDVRIYVDGVLASAEDAYVGGLNDSVAAFGIGLWDTNGSPSRQFDGLIDEVAIFDRALLAAEVLDIKTNGIDGTKGAND